MPKTNTSKNANFEDTANGTLTAAPVNGNGSKNGSAFGGKKATEVVAADVEQSEDESENEEQQETADPFCGKRYGLL